MDVKSQKAKQCQELKIYNLFDSDVFYINIAKKGKSVGGCYLGF